jgi:hypothetical protein
MTIVVSPMRPGAAGVPLASGSDATRHASCFSRTHEADENVDLALGRHRDRRMPEKRDDAAAW